MGLVTLRLLGFVSADMRAFMQVAPYYIAPISYETAKIESLLGPQHVTPYEDGIGQTLDWLRRESNGAQAA